MPSIKTYACECGEEFYEDDTNCQNCLAPIDKSKLKPEPYAEITSQSGVEVVSAGEIGEGRKFNQPVYISFGQTHVHQLGDGLYLHKDTLAKVHSREHAFRLFGADFFTDYPESKIDSIIKHFPSGIVDCTKIDRCPLRKFYL